MADDLHRKCHGCGRKHWLGDMFWRGVNRYCHKCAGEYTYG